MSVLRMGDSFGRFPGRDAGGMLHAVAVPCPKCQETIRVTGILRDEPIRCGKCAYPLIRRADLLRVIGACRKIANADQVGTAVRILNWLADTVPEAGTALGELANRYTVPVGDRERWNRLIAAYSGGDGNAREWLTRMCQSNPETYKTGPCKNCGAPKYYISGQRSKTLCIYCQSTD